MTHVLSLLGAFGVSSVGLGVLVWLALIPWRRLPSEPWTVRASRLQPIRAALASWALALPFAAFVASKLWMPTLSPVPAALGSVMGIAFCGWPMDRAVFPNQRIREWLSSSVVLSLMNGLWFALIIVAIAILPARASWNEVALGISGFLLMGAIVSGGLLFSLCAKLGLFHPAGPRLTRLVTETAADCRTPVRAIWELPSAAGYAAALVVQRALIFSTTTVAEHDDEELRAICRHELAHIREGRGLILLRVMQTPVLLTPFVLLPVAITEWGVGGFFAGILGWLLLSLGYTRLSLMLEKRADREAIAEADPTIYARALERLHRRNLVPAVLPPRTARTHPDLYDRMVAAGVTPDYPRPAPPTDVHWLNLLAIIVSVASTIGFMSTFVW